MKFLQQNPSVVVVVVVDISGSLSNEKLCLICGVVGWQGEACYAVRYCLPSDILQRNERGWSVWSGVLTDCHARVRLLSSDLYKKLAGSTVVANYPFSCDTFKKNTFKNIRQHFLRPKCLLTNKGDIYIKDRNTKLATFFHHLFFYFSLYFNLWEKWVLLWHTWVVGCITPWNPFK